MPPISPYKPIHLPIDDEKEALLTTIKNNSFTIVVGETGSGKTTRLPQFLLENDSSQATIACTQPRRIAAISVAKRVSTETKSDFGKLVGYSVRFDDNSCSQTRIKFMTDGILLREALHDKLLSKYSHIIIDEAHERSINTDVLLSIVKKIQDKRNELKIIIMSATMNASKFSTFFNNCPVHNIPGRLFNVKMMYTKTPIHDYLYSSLVTVYQINSSTKGNGTILLFLTGVEEIESSCKLIRKNEKIRKDNFCKLLAMPFYSNLPFEKQNKIFKKCSPDYRKVIISTNVAETSLTIKGVEHVIDCGHYKTKSLLKNDSFKRTANGKCVTSMCDIETIQVEQISKAHAIQRAGRAGRVATGICYRLYTEDVFNKFSIDPTPPIEKCRLDSLMLQLIGLEYNDPQNFDYLSKPNFQVVNVALEQLKNISCIKIVENSKMYVLTEKGKFMIKLPVDPCLSNIIYGAKNDIKMCVLE